MAKRRYTTPEVKEISTPSNPASTFYKFYFKSDWRLYTLDSAWTEKLLIRDLQEWFDWWQSIVIWDWDNQTFSLTNNDTTNNPTSISFTNTTTWYWLYWEQTWVLASWKHWLEIYTNAIQVNDYLVQFKSDNNSSTIWVLKNINDWTWINTLLVQNWAWIPLQIDNASTKGSVTLQEQASCDAPATWYWAFYFKTDWKPYAKGDDWVEKELWAWGWWISWGESLQGTTWNWLEINKYWSTTQATWFIDWMIYVWENFNTNSANTATRIYIKNEHNEWAWNNCWIRLQNYSYWNWTLWNYFWHWIYAEQISWQWSIVQFYAWTNALWYSLWLITIWASNTQNTAWKLLYINTWTSTHDHNTLYLTGTRQSVYLWDSDQAPSTTTNKLYALSGNLYWNWIKWWNWWITTIVSSATPTINTNTCSNVTITALATDITSMSTNLSWSPINFDKLTIRIKDDWTARAITRWASFEAKWVALPTTTIISKVLTIWFIYDSVTNKWWCVASVNEA